MEGSSSGWKDFACLFFVVLLVALAGFLKFQEEVFGSMDHLRSEADADADFYEILGVAHSASSREIRQAYRNKVMEVHPDRHPTCGDCPQKFMASTKAYEVLIDEEKRKVYDQTRGSYEPILSDYSVPLTAFNYERLVRESPAVWVIQVYDDLDPYSKHFASSWDIVAGSRLSNDLIKFGRVNARRDRAVLSLLPIRARTYPTVVMFSRDTLPSIFSLADMSSGALTRWIEREIPSHVNEESSNRYKILISGKATEPPVLIKSISVHFARVFDIEYTSSSKTSKPATLTLVDKDSSATLLTQNIRGDDLVSLVSSLKERLVLPVNRYNILDICGSSTSDNGVYCIFDDYAEESVLANRTMIVDGILLQQVYMNEPINLVVLDLPGSRIASYHHPLGDIDDLRFSIIDISEFVDLYFPLSYLERLKLHSTSIVAGLGVGIIFLAFTKIGALHITIAVGLMSIVVGIASSKGVIIEWLANKIR